MNFELLEDQLASAALQDALAFIDAYEQSIPASDHHPPAFMPELPPSPAELSTSRVIAIATPEVKKQHHPVQNGATRSKKRNHGDPKGEIERLHHDVKLLESKLVQVKSSNEYPQRLYEPFGKTNSSASSEADSLDGGSERETSLTSMWKAVALRQYQRRNHSEMTNRKLKEALERQLKVAKALEQLIVKRTAQDGPDLLLYDSPSFHWEASPLSRDDSISALLSNHVQQLRFDIDIHLINSGLTGPESRILRTLSKTDLFRGTVQETSSNTSLPLSLYNADYVLWGGMKMHHRQEPGGPPHDFAYVEDGVDKSYMTMIEGVKYSYNLATRTVMRKFVDKDRVVYAWTSIATVKNKNVRFRGEGLVVLERSGSAPLDSTLLRNWHRLYAEEMDSHVTSASERMKVTVLKALSQGSVEYFSSLENVLLRAAATQSIALPLDLCVPRL